MHWVRWNARLLLAGAALHGIACAAAPPPPPRAAGLKERSQPAGGMLAREYPRFAGELGPLPGHVTGLLMPPDSKWGRSLEWIGEAVASHPDSYVFPGDEKRGYELYAAGLAPRIVRRDGRRIVPDPSRKDPWGLSAEAHLAEVEIGNGFGTSLATTFEVDATGVRVLDGQPGYPESMVKLLDSARAEFDRFVRAQAPAIQRELAAGKATFPKTGETPSPDRITDVLYPYWDEARKTLVVVFHRRVMRMVQGSVPCLIVYEGMPPRPSSMPYRYGYGVELGQKLELDAGGALVGMTRFLPAGIQIAPDVSLSDRQSKGMEPCPGSPGLRERPWGQEPRGGPGTELLTAPTLQAKCGNGKRETTGPQPEECDGADLARQSCPNLGYLGGQLRCSASCMLDLDSCDPTAGPPARVMRRVVESDWAALALLEDGRIAAVGARGRAVTVHFFRGSPLEPVGAKAAWTLPGESGPPVDMPVAAAFGRSLLVAVTRYRGGPETLLLHMSPEGAISSTATTLPGRATFLVSRGDRALLGVMGARNDLQLETVVVDAAGKLLGGLQPAVVVQPGAGYARGAAVATPGGWLVSVGTNGPFSMAGSYARLDADGKRVGVGEVKAQAGQVTVARGPSSSFVVQTHPGGVLATEVSDSGAQSEPRLMGSGLFLWIAGAVVEGGRLVAWASESTGRVQRMELDLKTGETSARTAIAVPLYIPVAAVFRGGELVHLFQAAPVRNGAIDRALWLYLGR